MKRKKKEDSLFVKNEAILLLTQKNNLQRANLKQSNLIKNITGGCSCGTSLPAIQIKTTK